ncbi:MAG TPA: DUF3382 domain-containing protein, partial [Azospira sp.]|nr:DUF3382 domain-containing protein [Azospira sp.]
MSAITLSHAPTAGERFKDAAWAAFVVLLLGIPLLGLTTIDEGGKLVVHTRWPLLAGAVAVSFAGRLLFRWLGERWRQRSQRLAAVAPPAVDRRRHPLLGVVGWALLGASICLPLAFSDNRYVIDTATTVLIYVMLGWGLNVVVGLAGLLDLGYVAFYAVGAYTYALLFSHLGWTFWEALPAAGAMAATFGILLGYPILRLRGDYLAIVTLGFGEIIRVILVNWTELSNGPNGIGSIPRPTLFGLPFDRNPAEGTQSFATFF